MKPNLWQQILDSFYLCSAPKTWRPPILSDRDRWLYGENDDVTPEAIEEIKRLANAPAEDDPNWVVISGPAW